MQQALTCPLISVRRTEMSFRAGKIVVPTTNLAHKYKNQTYSGLNRACATRMYRSIIPLLATWNFRNFKSKFLLNGKMSLIPDCHGQQNMEQKLNSIPRASQCQRESNVLHFKQNNAPLTAIVQNKIPPPLKFKESRVAALAKDKDGLYHLAKSFSKGFRKSGLY